ncbi:conserved hypothetical protein [Moraxellaceae bacterium 17A]|nr:conserved hypothetical protein [Moraxellaceae bacterium 17A]
MQLAEIQSNKTMSSREIAQLCQKRHDNVCNDIRILNETYEKMGLLKIKDTLYTNEQNGQQYREYLLTKEQSIDLVTGYNRELRIAINRRWQELESSQSLTLPNFTDPAEAAIAWANEYKAKQALAIELKAAEPKINHYDKVVERKNLLNATQVGEKLDGMSAIILNRHLAELGVYNKSVKRGKVFSTWFIQKGYGEMKQSDAGFDQALFTQKGQAWVIEQLTSEGVV